MYGYLLGQDRFEEWADDNHGLKVATYEESSRRSFAAQNKPISPDEEGTFHQHVRFQVFSAAIRILYAKTRVGSGRARAVLLEDRDQLRYGMCSALACSDPARGPDVPPADRVEMLRTMLGTAVDEPQWYPLTSV